MDWLLETYWAVAGIALILSALVSTHVWEHRRFARSRVAHHQKRPLLAGRAAIFVPCKGADADLCDNLRPLFEQDHPSYALTFVVESGADSACQVIHQLMAAYPHQSARLVIAGLATTTGQKVHNLLCATDGLPADVTTLVFIDTDVCPSRDWLRLLVQRLGNCDASTGYRWFVPKRSTLANCLLSGVNGAAASIMSPGKHHVVWGGSWAIRRDVFEQIRLRDAWQGTLSDDLVATRVLAAAKKRVAFEPECMLPSPIDVNVCSMFSFLRRQLTIGRYYVPAIWLGSVAMIGLDQLIFWGSLAAGVWGLLGHSEWAWHPFLIAALSYTIRTFRGWVRQSAARAYMPHHQRALAGARFCDVWLGPFVGLTSFVALALSVVGNRIVWKGNTYEMRYGGQIRKIPPLPSRQTAAADAAAPASSQKRAA